MKKGQPMKLTKYTSEQRRLIDALKREIANRWNQIVHHQSCIKKLTAERKELNGKLAKILPTVTRSEINRAVTTERCRVAFMLRKEGWTYRQIGEMFGVKGNRASRMCWIGGNRCSVCGCKCFGQLCEKHSKDETMQTGPGNKKENN